LPGLATPLLIVRDPIALLVIVLAWKGEIIKANGYLMVTLVIAVIGFFSAVLFGHGNLVVALFGVRTIALHLPLVFIMGEVFDGQAVNKICKWMVYITIPMLVLIAFQFYSPQTAWINKSIYDGEEGAGFAGALDFFRPPGTFSFTNGNSLFFLTASSFIFFVLLKKGIVKPIWANLSLLCLLLSIPFSISRTLFFSVILNAVFVLFVVYTSPRRFWTILLAGSLFVLLANFLANTSFVGTGIAAFSERFNAANEAEGGLEGVFVDRL
jgi:hypothetical protein